MKLAQEMKNEDFVPLKINILQTTGPGFLTQQITRFLDQNKFIYENLTVFDKSAFYPLSN